MQTIREFDDQFADDDACKRYLASKRWPKGVSCVRCGATERVYELKARPFHWLCKNADCGGRNGYRFSVLTGTIFMDTKVPLSLWFKVGYLMMTSKKGISALQIHRVMFGEDSGSSYRTAWYMCQRWRAAMRGDAFKLDGVVEMDETFIGGKAGNRHKRKQLEFKEKNKRHPFGGKVGVIGAISRKGNVVCQVIERLNNDTISEFVNATVPDDVSLVATDDAVHYDCIKYGDDAPHKSVNHSQGEYVRGEVHTANLDQFWSLLKRGIMGSFHHVSAKYLPLYLNEFSFRHNMRKDADAFGALVATCS
jgi:transposase-like protein